jgi:hypothetical protein
MNVLQNFRTLTLTEYKQEGTYFPFLKSDGQEDNPSPFCCPSSPVRFSYFQCPYL